MPVPFAAPFDRQLLVFLGKGGVGKTTTAAAVALRAAKAGRRTLLVTIDPAQRLEDALGVPVDHRIREVHPNLYATMLDPKKVIEETLREVAPDRDLTQHPFYKYISNYMPGINELLAIGKLAELRKERDFATTVIDTAPTGHALSFLSLPLRVRDLLRENTLIKWALRGQTIYQRVARSGRWIQALLGRTEDLPDVPDIDYEALFQKISDRAGEIHDLLQDAERTALTVVTIAERLPVEETLDLHAYLTGDLRMPVAAVVVNKLNPDPMENLQAEFARYADDAAARDRVRAILGEAGYPSAIEAGLVEAARFGEIRHRMNQEHLHDLAQRLPDVPRFIVPLHADDVYGFDRLDAFGAELLGEADRA